MTQLADIKKINVDINKIENEFIAEKKISLSVLRLDKIHPEISGNKFFKLYYFLEQAITEQKKIITFGGAYSNHLAATAGACKEFGLNCIGIVRGEEPKNISHTLLFCKKQGMHLEFISREKYNRKDGEDFKIELTDKFGDHILIPEGGYSIKGAEGAALISNLYQSTDFDYICCAAGTATTLSGLIKSSTPSQKIIGFNALKDLANFEARIQFLLSSHVDKNYSLINDFHFGGYAKKTSELISFINKFYEAFAIPTDFVYTAKMMYGVFELIKRNYFPAGSKIICIHTGGLQGNLSLPAGTLNF
ncbi:MAG: hypothetical protein JWN83_1475 [Chitinophagaceae bacterium]|nr:hypothetical protein [Chitinophagaceae bacterium]